MQVRLFPVLVTSTLPGTTMPYITSVDDELSSGVPHPDWQSAVGAGVRK